MYCVILKEAVLVPAGGYTVYLQGPEIQMSAVYEGARSTYCSCGVLQFD